MDCARLPVYSLCSDEWNLHIHDEIPEDNEDPLPPNGDPHPWHGQYLLLNNVCNSGFSYFCSKMALVLWEVLAGGQGGVGAVESPPQPKAETYPIQGQSQLSELAPRDGTHRGIWLSSAQQCYRHPIICVV